LISGFYSLEECIPPISSYFAQYQPDSSLYGCLPIVEMTAKGGSKPADPTVATPVPLGSDEESIRLLVGTFDDHVNMSALIFDAWMFNVSFASIYFACACDIIFAGRLPLGTQYRSLIYHQWLRQFCPHCRLRRASTRVSTEHKFQVSTVSAT
jgi:hypothetical protein